jgi:phenylalanyl-tRNA synthetase beta chain
LPGDITIRKSKIRGVESQGMLCSARELGLGRDHEGILELPAAAPVGAVFVEAMMLNDVRIIVDVTPNRPDLLSHLGIAREVGAAAGIEPRLPDVREIAGGRARGAEAAIRAASGGPTAGGPRAAVSTADGVTVEITATDLCPRYLGLVIRGVKVAASPAWLSGPLRAIGARPINNVVDVTNFILNELGQPLHAFDLNKLGRSVVVRRARAGERITTLDGVERELGADMLVIADAARPVAIAGVMGGADTEVDAQTTEILLECALFQPASVRSTRTALGLSTDASYRFERGVDPDAMELALRRAADMILECAGGTVADVRVDAGTAEGRFAPPQTVALRIARITQVLGVDFDPSQIAALLSPIGFYADTSGPGDIVHVRVPGHRSYDVTREEDLIEEVARRYGYDNFPDELRPFRPSAVPDDRGAQTEDRLRDSLAGMGLLESRTLAFAPPSDGDVTLMLPLSSAEGVLRRAIVPSLLRRTEYNFTRGQRHVRLFEIGTAFFERTDSGDGDAASAAVPHEERHLGIVITGARAPAHWSGDAPPLDLWDLEGLLERIAAPAGLRIEPAAEARLPAWADPAAAWVARHPDGVIAGCGARVLPAAIDAPAWADPVFAIELDLTGFTADARPLAFRAIPAYPAVERDLALLVRHDLASASIMSAIAGSAGPLLETAFPFDLYTGKGVAEDRRSLAVRLRFRAADRTLTDEEVNRALERVLRTLKEDHGIDRRV